MKKVVGLLIILVLLVQFNISMAASQTELQNEQTQINSQIKEKEKEIQSLENQKSEAMKEVETLINQIASYEVELDELKTKIGDLEDQIEETEKNIESKQEEYNKEQELLDTVLIEMYEQGETTYLDVLFNSSDILDFISKYYVVSEITESNTQLLENISKQKAEIEEQKANLENQKKELNTTKASVEAKQTQLKAAQTTKTQYVSKLTAEEKEAQAEKEQYEQDKRDITAQLKKIAEEEAAKAKAEAEAKAKAKAEAEAKAKAAAAAKSNQSSSTTKTTSTSTTSSTTTIITSTPSSSGYIFPLAGKTKRNITTGYMGYSNPKMGNHTGVDIAIAGGTPIMAVKDGTVVTSTALKTTSGAYRSYGEYIVISHGDGTMTLYAHMTPGSRRVSVGDKVKQGQTIGLVGTTGNSTGYHLHFEVRINGSPVNPTPYLP